MRLLSGAWGIGLAVALAVCVQAADEPAKLKPVPSAKEQEEALTTIRSLFQKDFAQAKTIPQQMAVAQKIVETARTSGEDPIGQYTLYRVARDICAKCNEIETLVEIAAEVEEQFAPEGAKFRIDGLTGAVRGATLPSKKRELAELFEAAVEEAVAAERFPQAHDAINQAQTLARGSNDKELPKRLTEREKLLDKQQALFTAAEAAIEKADPNDQAGLLAVGKYLTFVKRDVEQGLDILSKSSDPQLAAQAKLDLAKPEEPTQVAAVADGWWQLADKYPELGGGIKSRAIELYRAALPGLAGLTKTKVEQRLVAAVESGGKRASTWVVVFRSANPKLWNTDYKGMDGMAKSLVNPPKGIKYLKLSLPGKGLAGTAIIEMTPERLTQKSLVGNVGWEGTKHDQWGGIHLGIYHTQFVFNQNGAPSIAEKGFRADYGGFGFGHTFDNNQQSWSWAGKPLPAGTVFEIALSPGPLTKEEEKVLVK